MRSVENKVAARCLVLDRFKSQSPSFRGNAEALSPEPKGKRCTCSPWVPGLATRSRNDGLRESADHARVCYSPIGDIKCSLKVCARMRVFRVRSLGASRRVRAELESCRRDYEKHSRSRRRQKSFRSWQRGPAGRLGGIRDILRTKVLTSAHSAFVSKVVNVRFGPFAVARHPPR